VCSAATKPTVPHFFFNADKKISIMKKTTTMTVYGIEALCGESDFWGWNRCWPVIDFS
jgi:hypothetical protein